MTAAGASLRHRMAVALGWLGFWTLVGLVFATQLYLAEQRLAVHPFSWLHVVGVSLPDWYVWGLFAIVIARLKQRVPIDGASWGDNFAFHVAASLMLALAHFAVAAPVHWLLPARALDTFAVSFLWNVITYWGILVGIHARDHYRDLQEQRLHAARLQARLAEARLHALVLQLQPHFLFNTLNAAAELMHEDLDAAERMLGRLSELLRSTLDTTGTQEISLERELQLVDRYLDIERIRFPDRLDVHLDIAPETRPALVPAMILLPLVENAIRHGVAGRGRVGVTARRSDGTLNLEVWDRGGAAPAPLPGGGIGLSNTRARLEQLYGDAHRFELAAGGSSGTVVRLAFPFRAAPA